MITKHLKMLALLTLSLSAIAQAGVGSGNTGIISDVTLSLSSQHPQHQLLIDRLDKALLPINLRQGIMNDIAKTSIMYSSEDITLADLKDSIIWQVISRTRVIADDDSVVVTEQLAPIKKLSELGFNIHTIPQIKGMDKDKVKNCCYLLPSIKAGDLFYQSFS